MKDESIGYILMVTITLWMYVVTLVDYTLK